MKIFGVFISSTKAEFKEEGTFFTNKFPSLRTFVNEISWKLKKTKPT